MKRYWNLACASLGLTVGLFLATWFNIFAGPLGSFLASLPAALLTIWFTVKARAEVEPSDRP